MSTTLPINRAIPSPTVAVIQRRVTVGRAAIALVWAAAVAVAVGNKVPTTDTDLPTVAAFFLGSYPLIDVIASLIGATVADSRALRINAAISTLATIAISVAAFGADAGATLIAFGAWAAVSGAIQLGMALRGRRTHGAQLPMIISGGLSTIAGLGFVASSRNDEAKLTALAGYMAFGALLYLVLARRERVQPATGRS